MRKAALVAVVAVYMTVTCAVDLFHNEDCQLASANVDTTHTICNGDPCPACMFSASYNSPDLPYGSVLIGAETGVVSKFQPQRTVVSHSECACSIISRAPPATTIL